MDNNIQPQDENIQPQEKPQKSLIDQIYGERKTLLEKLLTVVSIIFFILVPIVFILHIFTGIVYYSGLPSLPSNATAQADLSAIGYFLSAITNSAVYAFYGLVLAVLKRFIRK